MRAELCTGYNVFADMDENPTPPTPNAFLEAIKGHRLYRVAGGYIVGAWIMLQVAAIVLPGFGAAPWVLRALMIVIALGFGAALLMAWGYDRRAAGLPLLPRAPRGQLGWMLTAITPAAAVALFFLWHPLTRPAVPAPVITLRAAPPAPVAAPEKSVAVLPFENLSADQGNAFFADGVQDEVLTDLCKVADLKVISRTSVMQYKDTGHRNLPDIAQALGVAFVVEGSVQRAGNQIRVVAQLIDARTDAHKWAEKYDRPLDDVFAIQSEIAQAIAGQLQAVISPQEHVTMAERPTANVGAYEQYVRGKDIVERSLELDDQRAELLHAVDLLEDATRRDPAFVEAYCAAALAHDYLFSSGLDGTPARRALAETAVNTALRLRPASGEAHLARADFLFSCDRDFAGAGAELALARPRLPNSAGLYLLGALLDRYQSRWEESNRGLAKAHELNPSDTNVLDLIADNDVLTRRFADAERMYGPAVRPDRDPRFSTYVVASIDFAATGSTKKLSAALRDLPGYMDPGGGVTPSRIIAALAEGDPAAAAAALQVSPLPAFQDVDFSFYYPRAWYEAQIARAAGDDARARAAFAACRLVLESRATSLEQQPRLLAVLAQVDAGVGNGELALREALRAVELMPISRDAYDGPLVLQGLAQVYVWTGDHSHALAAVETLVRQPGYLTYGYLWKDPMWSPLRGDARFQALLASLAPKPGS